MYGDYVGDWERYSPKVTTLASVNGFFQLLSFVRSYKKRIEYHVKIVCDTDPYVLRVIKDLERCEVILLDIQYTTTRGWRVGVVRRYVKDLGNVSDFCERYFGFFLKSTTVNKGSLEQRILRSMKVANNKQRVNDLMARIMMELQEKLHYGWYPIFNTLTVSEEYYDKVFARDSRCWEHYVLRFKRLIGKECGHVYFGVVEAGEKTGRLHFHVLHLIEKLPKGSFDPNVGRIRCDLRIIDVFRKCWMYGTSDPVAVRMNGTDSYARLNWRWPVEMKGGKWNAVEPTDPLRLARYLTKYVTKAYGAKKWKWKTKMSRNYGTRS
jgi:hypothetical protein